jgi:hypothetical protein
MSWKNYEPMMPFFSLVACKISSHILVKAKDLYDKYLPLPSDFKA